MNVWPDDFALLQWPHMTSMKVVFSPKREVSKGQNKRNCLQIYLKRDNYAWIYDAQTDRAVKTGLGDQIF